MEAWAEVMTIWAKSEGYLPGRMVKISPHAHQALMHQPTSAVQRKT
jgi:hypothetical protein